MLSQFTVTPFGLCKIPSTLERLMVSVLWVLNYEAHLVYLYYHHCWTEVRGTADNLRNLFHRFRIAHLKFIVEKCDRFQEKVPYLEHVSAEGATTDPEKLQTAQLSSSPRDKQDLMGFHWLCNCNWRFIAGFAVITKQLTQLTQENRTKQWSPQVDSVFWSVKESLYRTSVLGCPLIVRNSSSTQTRAT